MIRAILIVVSLTTLAASADCVRVGDRILGRDLKAVRSGFTALPDDQVIGFAPLPGVQRVFRRRDLDRIAASLGILPVDGADVCFERAVVFLDPARIHAALKSALNRPEASIDLVDYTHAALPDGEIEFRLAGLAKAAPAPETPVVWRGRLRYEGGRSASIWATVRITETRTWLESAMALNADGIVTAGQVVLRADVSARTVLRSAV